MFSDRRIASQSFCPIWSSNRSHNRVTILACASGVSKWQESRPGFRKQRLFFKLLCLCLLSLLSYTIRKKSQLKDYIIFYMSNQRENAGGKLFSYCSYDDNDCVSYDFIIDSIEDRSSYHDTTDWFAKDSKLAFSTSSPVNIPWVFPGKHSISEIYRLNFYFNDPRNGWNSPEKFFLRSSQ